MATYGARAGAWGDWQWTAQVVWNDRCPPCQFPPGASISSPVKWGTYLDWHEA